MEVSKHKKFVTSTYICLNLFILGQVRWGGRNQDGAGNTVGEEVEQVNSFLSRAALTTKYMTMTKTKIQSSTQALHDKINVNLHLLCFVCTGRGDMLTMLAMGWNNRKVKSLHKTLAKRFVKARSLHYKLTPCTVLILTFVTLWLKG